VPQLNQGDEDDDDAGDSSGSSAKAGEGGGGDGVTLAQKLLDEAKAPCAVTFRDPERYKVILTIMNGLLRLLPCMRMPLAFIVSCFRCCFLSLFFWLVFWFATLYVFKLQELHPTEYTSFGASS
jgi:hypothetical protein